MKYSITLDPPSAAIGRWGPWERIVECVGPDLVAPFVVVDVYPQDVRCPVLVQIAVATGPDVLEVSRIIDQGRPPGWAAIPWSVSEGATLMARLMRLRKNRGAGLLTLEAITAPVPVLRPNGDGIEVTMAYCRTCGAVRG